MKYLKMLGLAAFAAMALTAMAGVGIASANTTILCSTNTSPCTGTQYGTGTTLHGTSTNALLTNSISNVTCTDSTFHATITGTTATGTPTGTISTLSFSSCHNTFGETCTAESKNLPWHGVITTEGTKSNGNGFLTATSGGTGNPGATVICGSLINCTFSTASAKLKVVGGSPAKAKAEGIALERTGGFCPSTSNWDAEYSLSEPSSLFVI